ncbi:hypothetical protein EXE59_09870 [Nocardioides eburneiflavus]|uniref:Uncharacterized protein n=1 Tax=Nocardioides eburneiflavus TaxID=2518372 RepID=A0A4Z1CA14_9ACTN|nr:hypothetical protein [Nocardioides eburneiflavus]TGN64226.1 hypothetical protein EXE59_09870 [Nocardioides eburneiflavus]
MWFWKRKTREHREPKALWGRRLAAILDVPEDAIEADDIHLVAGGAIVHLWPTPAGALVDHPRIDERLANVAPEFMIDPNSAADHFIGLIPRR